MFIKNLFNQIILCLEIAFKLLILIICVDVAPHCNSIKYKFRIFPLIVFHYFHHNADEYEHSEVIESFCANELIKTG